MSEMKCCQKSKPPSKKFTQTDYEEIIDIPIKSLLHSLIEYAWLEKNEAKDTATQSEEIIDNMQQILPFLVDFENNIKETREDGRSILEVFLEKYLSTTWEMPREKVLRMKNFMKKLIDFGASPYVFNQDGKSVIQLATECMNNQILEALITCLDDVNACDENGNTALHIVVANCVDNDIEQHKDGYENIIQTLLSKGADVNKKNKKGETPVHWAARKFYINVLKIFADYSADFTLSTLEDETPLHFACKSASRIGSSLKNETIEFLVNQGCELHSTSKIGFMPLHHAVQLEMNMDLVEKLIELGADINCLEKYIQLTPLHLAPISGRLDIVKKLVEAGADVNAETLDGATPVFVVALVGSFEIMMYLIDHGAEIHRRDKGTGLTLLHIAAYANDLPVNPDQEGRKLNYFLEKGLDVNDPAHCGFTPLQLAVLTDNEQAVKTLIKHGANVNYQHEEDMTALHIAALRTNFPIVKILIEAGADVSCITGIEQWTPLFLIITDAFPSSAKSLIIVANNYPPCYENSQTYDTTSLKPQRSDFLTFLIENGAEIDAKDAFGRCPLHYAVLRSDSQLCKILLDGGAYCNVQDNQGQTPLLNSIKNKPWETFQLLLDYGANMNDDDIIEEIMKSDDDEVKTAADSHAAKLKFLGLPIAKVYESFLIEHDKDFDADCLEEIEKLKKHLIGDISLYQILHMNFKRKHNFHKEICNQLPSIEDLYPMLWNVIAGINREAYNRRWLHQECKMVLERICSTRLPDVCLEKILSNLSNRYLDVLLDVEIPDEKITVDQVAN